MFFSPILLDVLNSGHYYLDPGSGSILIQVLIAGLLGAAYAIKVYWRRIRSIFRRKSNPPDIQSQPSVDHSPDDPANR